MKALLLLTGIILMSWRPADERRLVAWVIEPSSNLVINGASNVNDFSCGLNTYHHADTLKVIDRTRSQISFSSNKLSIPIGDFDCKNKLITKDFQETLQSDKFPQIGISFLRFDVVEGQNTVVDNYDARVLIELAGVTREVGIRFNFWEKSYSQYQLTGRKAVRFSDFGFEPPTKVMGLVKVEDELTIDFNLVMRPL